MVFPETESVLIVTAASFLGLASPEPELTPLVPVMVPVLAWVASLAPVFEPEPTP